MSTAEPLTAEQRAELAGIDVEMQEYVSDNTYLAAFPPADLDRVRVRAGAVIVADHARIWAHGAVVTDPAHKDAAAVLRRQFQHPRAATTDDGMLRDLADYDRAFGIPTGEAS